MKTNFVNISVMLFLVYALVSAAKDSHESSQENSEESDEKPNVVVARSRRDSSESDRDTSFENFDFFNGRGSRSRNGCSAKLGSGSCRNNRDCLPGEQCRGRWLEWYFNLRYRGKCCVRRPTTTSAPSTNSETPTSTITTTT